MESARWLAFTTQCTHASRRGRKSVISTVGDRMGKGSKWYVDAFTSDEDKLESLGFMAVAL